MEASRSNALCGNGILSEGEVCDGDAGLPDSCEDFNPDKDWKPGGKPGCADNCKKLTQGTCQEIQRKSLTFMNWNVEVDYQTWGGSPVPPRAEKLHKAMKSWKHLPEIFAIIEVAPNWHAQSALFEDLGYAWADTPIKDTWWDFNYAGFSCGENKENAFLETTTEDQAASCFLFTDLLYQKDLFELVEADYVKLFPPKDWNGLPENCNLHIRGDFCSTYDPDSLYCNNKTIAFAAVLREKATGVEFIAVSTHWNPNNGVVGSDLLGGIFGPVADNELVRAYGAQVMADFIDAYRAKYPNAYVIAGGDFNTIDFSILYTSTESVMALEALTAGITITDSRSLIRAINSLMFGKYSADRLSEDFPGSHAVFKKLSGLNDARAEAVANIPGTVDASTTVEIQRISQLDSLSLKAVIDYTFYSPNLQLTSYKVVNDKAVEGISDHYPIVTQYLYELP